ncbi:unnamed protein product [Sphagnum balticum]
MVVEFSSLLKGQTDSRRTPDGVAVDNRDGVAAVAIVIVDCLGVSLGAADRGCARGLAIPPIIPEDNFIPLS